MALTVISNFHLCPQREELRDPTRNAFSIQSAKNNFDYKNITREGSL